MYVILTACHIVILHINIFSSKLFSLELWKLMALLFYSIKLNYIHYSHHEHTLKKTREKKWPIDTAEVIRIPFATAFQVTSLLIRMYGIIDISFEKWMFALLNSNTWNRWHSNGNMKWRTKKKGRPIMVNV